MKQKVWVIGDDDPVDPWDPWEVDRTQALAPDPVEEVSSARPDAKRKSPAAAFSLSLVVWGSGQFYLGKSRPGSIYMATMVLLYAAVTAMTVSPGVTGRLFLEQPIPLAAGLLLGLLVWLGNAVDAYCRAVSMRTAPFLGLDRPLWPVLASLLLPGWGQFLNGQPKKGGLFLLGTLCGVYSALLLIAAGRFWSLVGMSPYRTFIEINLIAAAVSVPLVLTLWIASSYDAFRSCEDFIRNKQRPQTAGRRLPGGRLLQDLSAPCSAVLGLMLAVSLGMQFIPKEFYLVALKRLQAEMLQSHLTFIPELIRKATELLHG